MGSQQIKPRLPSNTRVGWIGLGVMGKPMCGHVLAKGYQFCVHTRTKAKAQSLLDQGAAWADSPKSLAEQSDVVVCMVGFPHEVRDVYFSENGLFAGTRP